MPTISHRRSRSDHDPKSAHEFTINVRARLVRTGQSAQFSDIEHCVVTGAWYKKDSPGTAATMVVTLRNLTRAATTGH